MLQNFPALIGYSSQKGLQLVPIKHIAVNVSSLFIKVLNLLPQWFLQELYSIIELFQNITNYFVQWPYKLFTLFFVKSHQKTTLFFLSLVIFVSAADYLFLKIFLGMQLDPSFFQFYSLLDEFGGTVWLYFLIWTGIVDQPKFFSSLATISQYILISSIVSNHNTHNIQVHSFITTILSIKLINTSTLLSDLPIELYQFYQMHIQYQDQEKQSLLSTSEIQPQQLQQPKYTELKQIPKYTPTDTPTEEVKEVIHKVQYGDTLEGLSLQYSVPLGRIKHRNNIDGDYIYHLRQIIIPNPKTQPPSKEVTQEMLVEEFLANMNYSEKDRKVAKYYLLQNGWNFDAALKQYRSDLEWQKKNKPEIKVQNLIQGKSEGKHIQKFYQMQELRHKKIN